MMKIILLILLTSCTILKAEYPRHKIRGPPHGHRIPPSQQFAKKWHQPSQYPSRNPVRSRPIPVHMPPSHKIPMGVPQAPPRAVAPPVRTFWKNTAPNIKYPQEKPYAPPKEKPFLIAAPSINTQEFDYHIQTNSIPTTHTNPIKQVGEKGPIHTIPAPNLSLKDKPIVVEESRYQHNTPYIQVEQSHQYQVTEQPEPPPKQKLYRGQQQLIQQQQMHQQQLQQAQQQQLHQQQAQQQQLHQQQAQQQQIHQQQLQQQQLQLQQEQLLQQELQKQIELQPQQLYYTTDAIALPQTSLPLPTPKTSQGDMYLSTQLNPKDLYQLIGAAYPQQEVASQIQTQEVQQSFYKPQQVPNYQALLSQQLFHPEQGFVQHLQPAEAQVASDKVFQPELHSFNYDEQAHQKNQKGLSQKELSTLVTAAYNLDSNVAASNQISARNSIDPLAQAQLIQSYFDTRSDVEENDVEPDAKPGGEQETGSDKIKEELLSSSYFASLPNKEAADRLAELQAAGKINSNLMKVSSDDQQQKDPMTILIPDDAEQEAQEDNSREESNENYAENSKEQPAEYDDYSLEESENSASEEENLGFGHRLPPKKRNN